MPEHTTFLGSLEWERPQKRLGECLLTGVMPWRYVALGGEILGRGAPRLPNTLSVLFPVPGDLIVMALDLAGVYASNGSACSSGGAQESHVVQAMGRRGIPVRLSLGEASDVDAVLPILKKVLQQCSVTF